MGLLQLGETAFLLDLAGSLSASCPVASGWSLEAHRFIVNRIIDNLGDYLATAVCSE
jgi:hypothetical protein